MDDPFDTATLRARVLRAWTDSPARFREDANAEEDLRLGGYRDRALVELAQNAADAAGQSGGELSLSRSGGELRAANTGRPLDASGVEALAALRASAKREGGSVGRFGVGFSAVLAVSEEPSLCSVRGGVRFSAQRTRDEVAAVPALAAELAARGGAVPVLRLPWPDDRAVPDGFATEVRLPLLPGVDARALLAQARELAPDLLLALPALRAVTVDGVRLSSERDEARADEGGALRVGTDRWVTERSSGVLGTRAGLGVEETARYSVTWAVRVDDAGGPLPAAEQDVLHTPTPTDERTSLPARLLATVPMEPSRRRVRAGAATDEVLAAAVDAYPRLLRRFPAPARLHLVPLPGFPLSGVDSVLRDGVLQRCRAEPLWLTAAGTDTSASAASVIEQCSPELAELLADVLPGLLAAELSDPHTAAARTALGIRRLGLAEVAETTLGLAREPAWWRALYAACAELLDRRAGRGGGDADRDELGGLPVPMLDGRTVPGPRGALLPTSELAKLPGLDRLGLPVVHPDAVHPLLRRLGAREVAVADLLDTDALRDAVRGSVDDALAGLDTTPLADTVLALVGEVSEVGGRLWLGALALPDSGGGTRRADELLLPDAALRDVLDPDAVGDAEFAGEAPLGALAQKAAERYPRAALAAVGVLDGFAVVTDDEPTGPDHDLDDEARWWDRAQPRSVHAVRDLDLVADDRWPAALAQLAAEPRTWRALAEPGGYTGWWLARYALLGGRPPRSWRLPEATALAGLYPGVPDTGLAPEVLAAAGVRAELSVHTAEDAAELLDVLADPDRGIGAGAVLRAHAELAEAVRDNRFQVSDVDSPAVVRALAGTLDAERAVVADRPWFAAAMPAAELVSVDPPELAEPLASLLDLPLASAELPTAVTSHGEPARWSELGAVTAACELLGEPVPDGTVTLHERLLVSVDGVQREVPWWVDTAGAVHATDDEHGLARALATALDRWPQRHRVAALLADPDPTTLLG